VVVAVTVELPNDVGIAEIVVVDADAAIFAANGTNRKQSADARRHDIESKQLIIRATHDSQ
jgi:hypothetical protein